MNADGSPGEETGGDLELVAFGARVRDLRTKAGLTQEELAVAVGLHSTYIDQVERGERNLTYKTILRLARALDVAPAALF